MKTREEALEYLRRGHPDVAFTIAPGRSEDEAPYISAASQRALDNLEMSFDGDEFTVGWPGHWHGHHDDLREAVATMDAIIEESRAAMVAYADDWCCGATLDEPNEQMWTAFVRRQSWGRMPNRYVGTTWRGTWRRSSP